MLRIKAAPFIAPAKAGELQITRALRPELSGTGLRVATLDPGLAETEFSQVRFKGYPARAKRVYESTRPLSAEDIAVTLVWIATRPPHVNIDELLLKPTGQAAILRTRVGCVFVWFVVRRPFKKRRV